jgi:peptidoglycan/xylan/chitin deacetylase (PgdA/CDA1 family)
MRIPGVRRLRRMMQRPPRERGGERPSALILMYHRVAEEPVDPWRLCVSPAHFEAHLSVLRARGGLCTLDDVVARTPLDGAVAVTFDDGYDDTLGTAAPLLARHEVPATVFVTTAGFDGDGACWWDVLAELLLRPGRLPEALHLRVGGREHAWALGPQAAYEEDEAARHRAWLPGAPPPTARHALYLDLWQLLIERPPEEQACALDALRAWAGADGMPPGRLLTREEVARLSAYVEVGGHTIHHPALPALDEGGRVWEIAEGKRQLEDAIGRPAVHFAYPYGRYGPAVAAAVRAAGFKSAVTTDPGRVKPASDPFALPRVQVPDLDGDAFARWLDTL